MRKRSWSKHGQAPHIVAKPRLTGDKVMQCEWWDWNGIVQYEHLHSFKKSIDSDLYFQQLIMLKKLLVKNRTYL